MESSRPYFDRYIAGDRKAVWAELIALGEQVRLGPLFDDALAVARETVRRARHNVKLIHHRLVGLGYQFADPDAAFVPAGPDAPDRIAEIEQRLGTFPLLARAWYESIASLDFSQAECQLRGPAGPDVHALGANPELIMQGLDRGWEAWIRMCAQHEEYGREVAPLAAEDPDLHARLIRPMGPFLPTGGYASNCDPRGFSLPCLGADGVLYNDGGGDIYLIMVLRHGFECGGFPFWHHYAASKRALPWKARPNWERLFPLLRDGLVPI